LHIIVKKEEIIFWYNIKSFMNELSPKLRIGVLRGGPSNEYEVSLATGKTVLKHLRDKYVVRDILIDKEGNWHMDGLVKSPQNILKQVDVIFNALHGEYGEDGTVQKTLETFNVPFTGSSALASSISRNKHIAKQVYKTKFLKTPHYEVIKRDEATQANLFSIYANLEKPIVVKPSSSGSSLGVTVVNDWAEFLFAVEKAFEFGPIAIVEALLSGKEATCGVVESSQEKNKSYALMPLEIVYPEDKKIFDFNSKYKSKQDGGAEKVFPTSFTPEEISKIQTMAQAAHHALGLRHYSNSDFMITPDDVFIIETNSLPGMTEHSVFPHALQAAECEIPEFLEHVILLAMRG
jgi:D-alanine-D-alanine ligase